MRSTLLAYYLLEVELARNYTKRIGDAFASTATRPILESAPSPVTAASQASVPCWDEALKETIAGNLRLSTRLNLKEKKKEGRKETWRIDLLSDQGH